MRAANGERRTFGTIVMEYRAGLGIIPSNSVYFEDQRPRFRSWIQAEQWAWQIQAESEQVRS